MDKNQKENFNIEKIKNDNIKINETTEYELKHSVDDYMNNLMMERIDDIMWKNTEKFASLETGGNIEGGKLDKKISDECDEKYSIGICSKCLKSHCALVPWRKSGIASYDNWLHREGKPHIKDPKWEVCPELRELIKSKRMPNLQHNTCMEFVDTLHREINMKNQLTYVNEEDYVIRTTLHWGQLKLFLSEVELLNKITKEHKGKKIIVVYAGAAPGDHTPYLHKLYPHVYFELYDPNKFRISSDQKEGKIKTYIQFFTDEDAEYWRDLLKHRGKKLSKKGSKEDDEDDSSNVKSVDGGEVDGCDVDDDNSNEDDKSQSVDGGEVDGGEVDGGEVDGEEVDGGEVDGKDALSSVGSVLSGVEVTEEIRGGKDDTGDKSSEDEYKTDTKYSNKGLDFNNPSDDHDTNKMEQLIKEGAIIAFISDIRSDPPTDENILYNMNMQLKWWTIMNPDYAMFKFRLLWTKGHMMYPEGQVMLQVFPGSTSTEMRLIVKKDAKLVKYDNTEYERANFYHNKIDRVKQYNHHLGKLHFIRDKLDNCYDCSCFIELMYEYLNIMGKPSDKDSLKKLVFDVQKNIIGDKIFERSMKDLKTRIDIVYRKQYLPCNDYNCRLCMSGYREKTKMKSHATRENEERYKNRKLKI